jgi:UDP-2,3-diacylglucosamine pyrophosphatase LpxH
MEGQPIVPEVHLMLDAVILSDIHLGSDNCQAKYVCRLLERIVDEEIVTQRLILNGDVFDSIDFRRLSKNHWKVLSLIRKLSDHLDIIWLAGNHDGSAEIVSHLLGVTVMDDYVLESGGQRLLILHGHLFDAFLDNHPVLTWLADSIYHSLQWIDRTHYFAKLAKRGSKTFLRCTRKIEEGALDMARRRHCTSACCGHTHVALAHTDQPIAYYNSGCWTELPCHYLTVADGLVRLHAVEAETALVEAEGSKVPATLAS